MEGRRWMHHGPVNVADWEDRPAYRMSKYHYPPPGSLEHVTHCPVAQLKVYATTTSIMSHFEVVFLYEHSSIEYSIVIVFNLVFSRAAVNNSQWSSNVFDVYHIKSLALCC